MLAARLLLLRMGWINDLTLLRTENTDFRDRADRGDDHLGRGHQYDVKDIHPDYRYYTGTLVMR